MNPSNSVALDPIFDATRSTSSQNRRFTKPFRGCDCAGVGHRIRRIPGSQELLIPCARCRPEQFRAYQDAQSRLLQKWGGSAHG